MRIDFWISAVGTVAGLCTSLAFVPQVVKIWKQGGRDLSYGMLTLYLTGAVLWLAYGIMLRAPAIIWTNVATGMLLAIATVLKAWTGPKSTSGGRLSTETSEGA